MDWFRIKHTIRLYLTFSSIKRAEYIKEHDLFYSVGTNCSVMFRKMPLYPKLISLGNNVRIASQVSLITHDGIHRMLNNCVQGVKLKENIGCIEIKDNVFVGSNTTILPGVTIGPNTIVGAGSLVNRSIGTGVYGGVPAKYICSWETLLRNEKHWSRFKSNIVSKAACQRILLRLVGNSISITTIDCTGSIME